jgi:thiamine biosynthesis lipoprotein ApbE
MATVRSRFRKSSPRAADAADRDILFMRRTYLFAALATIATAAAGAVVLHHRATPYRFRYENVLGTSMDMTVVATSAGSANAAAARVLDRIDRDAEMLSGYDPASEFSQWFRTRGEAVAVSPELFEVLALFDDWRDRTGGALDASAEAVSRVWKQAASLKRLPGDGEITAAVAQVRQPHWRLDAAARTATHLDGTPLMLNSFTKSYIIDRAVRAALDGGSARAVVVNIGGDLVTRGTWTEPVAVTDPFANADNAAPLTRLAVRNRAVATSGSYRRGFDIGGRHYSHIVDPRTGRPVSQVVSATVLAPRAADAGALATAFNVLAPEDSERLAMSVPGAEFLLVLADGSRIQSGGWRALTADAQPRLPVPSPVARVFAAGQSGFALDVNVEIAQIQGGGRVERPYLAIWIEDKDKVPVRTLTVLYRPNEARFLADLRAWYRADRLRAMADGTEIIGSVSSATRSPGRYTFTWDMNDQQGKPVKPGTYTVCIEAAREHGTYQLMRHAMDFTGAPKQATVPISGIEITAASLDYHKTPAR